MELTAAQQTLADDIMQRYQAVVAAMRALDEALQAMHTPADPCPFKGYDFDDLPTSADLYLSVEYEALAEEVAAEIGNYQNEDDQ